MTIHADALLERHRLQQQVSRWRIVALLVILLGAIAVLGGKSEFVNLGHKPYIARLHISGVILQDSFRDKEIRKLIDDEMVQAVVVYIDSPGGTSIGGEQLYQALNELAEEKPMVAVMGGMATSAAYLSSVAAEYIVAHEATVTGSIGVIFEIPDLQILAEKVGVGAHKIATDPLKGQPSTIEPLSAEVQVILQSVVDDFHRYFIESVATGRNLSKGKVRALGDGRIYSARQAVDYELVDAIGSEQTAIDWLEETHGIEELPVSDIDLIPAEEQWRESLGATVDGLFRRYGIVHEGGLLSISKKLL